MKIEVDEAVGCARCPMFYSNSEYPDTVCKANGRNIGGMGHYEGGPSPDWCPLRAGPVTVEMKPNPQARPLRPGVTGSAARRVEVTGFMESEYLCDDFDDEGDGP